MPLILLLIFAVSTEVFFSDPDCTIPESIQYEDVRTGNGDLIREDTIIEIDVTIMLQDGRVISSTEWHGVPIRMVYGTDEILDGIDTGICGMRVGGKRSLNIPPELAFGIFSDHQAVPDNSTIVAEVQVRNMFEMPEQWNVSEDKFQESESGLKYAVYEEGSGDVSEEGDFVEVFYNGYLEDGTMFASSVINNTHFGFRIGDSAIIDGVQEGVTGMRLNERRILVIPPELGYGTSVPEYGIPANATLYFNLELLYIGKD